MHVLAVLLGLDLLESLLTFDASRRMCARDALKHCYLTDYAQREPSAKIPLCIEHEVILVGWIKLLLMQSTAHPFRLNSLI